MDQEAGAPISTLVHETWQREQNTPRKTAGLDQLWQALGGHGATRGLAPLDHEQLTLLCRLYDRRFHWQLKQPKALLPKTATPTLVGYG